MSSENTDRPVLSEVKKSDCSVPLCDCYPHHYDLIKSMTSSLAWPLLIAFIFFFFRKKIESVFDKILKSKKFKAGTDGILIEMDIENEIKKEADSVKKESIAPVNQDLKNYEKASDVIGEVTVKWKKLEDALYSIALGVITIASDVNDLDLISDLHAVGEIDAHEKKTLLVLLRYKNWLVDRPNKIDGKKENIRSFFILLEYNIKKFQNRI